LTALNVGIQEAPPKQQATT